MTVQFPFKKLLKRFNTDEYGGDRAATEKAAWEYGKKIREALLITELVEFFGVVVETSKRVRNAWDVFLESWEGITGSINLGEKFKGLKHFSHSDEEDK